MTIPPIIDEAILSTMLHEQVAQNKDLRIQLQRQTELIAKLQHQLSVLQSMIFGQKSERRKHHPSSTANSTEQTEPTLVINTVKDNDKQNAHNGRRKLPSNLERKKVYHDLTDAQKQCPCCDSKLQCIGKEITEQLDFVPAKLIAVEHIRYKYSCRLCRNYVAIAKMPEQPIDKGLAGSALLAEILINKYQDALALYRQQMRWARLGYELPRSTMCDWVMQSGLRLKPIVDAMKETCLMPSRKIHTDDTPFPILAEKKAHKGYLWVYIGNAGNAPPCVIYQYSKRRTQSVPLKFLQNYRGYVQADAYPGYNKLYKSGHIIEVACWAHTRRKYMDIVKSLEGPSLANIAIDFIGELYRIEKQCKNMLAPQRYFFRKHFAKPILKIFYRWLCQCKSTAPPKSPFGAAINYTLNHWGALNNYLRDGILAIDNNAAERAMKPFVIGRKNFLFAGSHKGAEIAAVIYSLIESCKILNINPRDYFKDVLERLPTTLNKNIADLFPCFWKPRPTCCS